MTNNEIKECFDMTNFTTNIKYLRYKKDLSQQQVANNIGIKQRAYSDYENNKSSPPLDVVVKLEKLFGETLNNLVHASLYVIAFKEDRKYLEDVANVTGYKISEVVDAFIEEGFIAVGDKIKGKKHVFKTEIFQKYKEHTDKIKQTGGIIT